MAAAQVVESNKDPQSGIDDHPPRKRKRVQDAKGTTKAPRRVKKVSLGRLLDMPPEVFNEIATHLFPADLLSLARSNKFFRNMFMSRTSHHLWKQALVNDPDIPNCPPELSEPQYVSLLFSKTCSSCGARVLRRMDPYLYVRLCNTCRDEQIVELSFLHPLIPILPYSDVIKEPRFGHVYTLRNELSKIPAEEKQILNNKNNDSLERLKERIAEMGKRRVRGEELEGYLDVLEEERESELDELKAQRRDQIEARLLEEGWTRQSMKASPENSTEWNRLVSQPKPITDRIWNNLYPKLVPLLKLNRAYNERADRENRRRDRIKKLQALVKGVREALPPLVHLTRENPSNNNQTVESSTSSASASNTRNSDVKVEQPFPSTMELIAWPMIKSIVDNDMSPEEAETKFNEIRDEFDRAVVEWRDKIEQELVAIWNANREEEVKTEAPAGKGKGKARAVARPTRAGTRKTRASTGVSTNASGSQAVELVLPEFVTTFTKPDGTTTTNISDLHPNLQLLLRADTMFKSVDGFILYRTYPAIVPRAVPLGLVIGGPEGLNYGDRWNGSKFRRDDETSTVAKNLLARIGRPDAIAVEMKALGVNFRCGRCNRTLTDTWEDLVRHYTTEQTNYKRAQEKIGAEPQSGFVFHNTHGLEPGNPKPFAHLMTPQESAEYTFQASMQHSPMMT
ncbi:hypothetical protein FRC11_012975, partial [Ceratobasidium sp. 423]